MHLAVFPTQGSVSFPEPHPHLIVTCVHFSGVTGFSPTVLPALLPADCVVVVVVLNFVVLGKRSMSFVPSPAQLL